jgi:hypothetical protein
MESCRRVLDYLWKVPARATRSHAGREANDRRGCTRSQLDETAAAEATELLSVFEQVRAWRGGGGGSGAVGRGQ